jgi:hypothetical protein
MDVALGGFAGALGLFGLFAGIALLAWVSNKGDSEKRKLNHEAEQQRRQLEHTERMKALEAGYSLPDADLAQAQTDRVRAGVAAGIGITVPVVIMGGAVAATALVLSLANPSLHLPVLSVLWPCCAVAAMVTAVVSLGAVKSRRRQTDSNRRAGTKPFADEPPGLRERITTLE